MFIVFEVADPDRLSVVPLDGTEPNPVREFCRAENLADLCNAIEDAGAAEVCDRHDALVAQMGAAGASPAILSFRRGAMDVLRGAGLALADIDDAS